MVTATMVSFKGIFLLEHKVGWVYMCYSREKTNDGEIYSLFSIPLPKTLSSFVLLLHLLFLLSVSIASFDFVSMKLNRFGELSFSLLKS